MSKTPARTAPTATATAIDSTERHPSAFPTMTIDGTLSAGRATNSAPAVPVPTPVASKAVTIGISPAVGITNATPTMAATTTATTPNRASKSYSPVSHGLRSPITNTVIRCSGTMTRPIRESERRKRIGAVETGSCVTSSSELRALVRPGNQRPINADAPVAMSKPTKSRVAANCHGSTSARNTITAGFKSGFPTQYARAALLDTPERRSPAVTGAAQQVHIMLGMENRAPVRDCRRAVDRFITCISQSRLNSASIVAATNRATKSAFQTAPK